MAQQFYDRVLDQYRIKRTKNSGMMSAKTTYSSLNNSTSVNSTDFPPLAKDVETRCIRGNKSRPV
jgi:hypothetical protein